MRHFQATIFDADGQQQTLALQGVTTESIEQYLHQQGYTIQSIQEVQAQNLWSWLQNIEVGQRISPQNRIRVIRTLGEMIQRGYAIDRVMDFLLADERQKDVIKLLQILQSKAKQGYTDFVELFREAEDYFDEEFFSLLLAGQQTGTVGQNMVDYAEGKEQMRQQKQALIKTLSSKMVLLGIVIVAFLVIVLFVVPQFQDLFGTSLELPLGMQIMVTLSNLLRSSGLWIVLGLVLIWGLMTGVYILSEEWRFRFQELMVKLPLWGGLQRMMSTRNFLYLMGNLLSKGVPLMSAIRIVRDQTRHLGFRAVYEAVRKNLEKGRKLEDVLRPLPAEMIANGSFVEVPQGYLLESVAQAMMLGSKGGNLGEMLTEAYRSYDVQLQNRISMVIRLLGMGVSLFTYGVILFMIGSLAMTLFRVMEDPTVFI